VLHPSRLLVRLLLLALVTAGSLYAWRAHFRAWNPGMRLPLLSYDAAQYAVAARELADRGTLTTIYALPLELSKHPTPPWPLAVVQPGLVLTEALLFKFVEPENEHGTPETPFRLTWDREWLALLVPFLSYVALALLIALTTVHLLGGPGGTSFILGAAAGGVAAFGFVLDPEAQHFASGGFTEMPFTFGWLAALCGFAMRSARLDAMAHPRWVPVDRPSIWDRAPHLASAPAFAIAVGLALGFTGLFRGSMLWMAPLMALGLALANPDNRRQIFLLTLAAYAAPLLPWWIYKWRAFGSPGWDLSALSVWDRVQGHSWFSLFHLPVLPELPKGPAAFGALFGKVVANVPLVLVALLSGLRGLWLVVLIFWVVTERERKGLRAVGLVILAAVAANVLVVAGSVPVLRYLFPSRIALELAGLLAMWDLLGRLFRFGATATGILALRATLALMVLVWGALQNTRGLVEARETSRERGLPMRMTLVDLAGMVRREVAEGEPLMSNLGPTLAWHTGHPVVHLALTPADVDACRRLVDTRHVILAFREAERAWPGWNELMANPEQAPSRPDWNVARVRAFRSPDGFSIVWLDMRPLLSALPASTGSP
jgi:hypothetical protein